MKMIVFTEEFCNTEDLYPFTLTRKVQDLRIGMSTIREKWEILLGLPSFDLYEGNYKDGPGSLNSSELQKAELIYLIQSNFIPTPEIIKQVKKLKSGESLSFSGKENLVRCIQPEEVINEKKRLKIKKSIGLKEPVITIQFPWDIVKYNAELLHIDFGWFIKNKKKQNISKSNRSVNPAFIFIEKGARVEHCIINASEGPVYIAQNAYVMEGAMLRGPIYIGEGTVIKMGATVYGGTSLGPNCIAGGEIKNTVFIGNSNKAHHGYIGDSVVGEWCNMGAGTSNSNIKNTASTVSVFTPSGLKQAGTKCGVMMGDYSRTAINTSINTGTIIGVCSTIFEPGLTPKHIPSFSWGSTGTEKYQFEKALIDIENWKKLKAQSLTDLEKSILKFIFEH